MIASLAVSIPMNRLSTVCSKLSRRALVFGPLHEFLTLIRTQLCSSLSVLREHCKRGSEQLIKNYPMDECQLDELGSFVKKRKHVSQHLRNWQPSMAIKGSGSALTHATK